MSKSQELAIQILLDAGFVQDGATAEKTVRIPTVRSPAFNGGRSGGELAHYGGRPRFVLQGSNVKATVGPRTVNIYRLEGHGLDGVHGIAHLKTSDLAGLKAALSGLNA